MSDRVKRGDCLHQLRITVRSNIDSLNHWRQQVTMDDEDLKINGVDEIFESFVKKKLRQLGIKRAATQNSDGRAMSELEMSIKLRLERNMAHENSKKDEKVDTTTFDPVKSNGGEVSKPGDEFVENVEDGPSKPKKPKKEKKRKKKKKKKDIWEEKDVAGREKERKRKKSRDKLQSKNLSKETKKCKISEEISKSELSSLPVDNLTKLELKSMQNGETSAKKLLHATEEGPSKLYVIKDNTDKLNDSVVTATVEKLLPEDITTAVCQHSTSLVKNADVMATAENESTEPKSNNTAVEISLPENRPAALPQPGSSLVKNAVVTATNDKLLLKNESSASTEAKSVDGAVGELLKTNSVAMLGPKRDIATIKMKIELLKARSEGQKISEELKGLLKKTTNGQKKEEKKSRKPETKASNRSESRSRKHSKSRSRNYSRSCSRDRKHSRHRRSRSPQKQRHRRSRSRDRHHRKRSRRRSRSPLISTADKVRLLEIAKANALAQHKAMNTASHVLGIGQIVKEGSMSVSELTSMCKDIATSKDEESVPVEPLTKESAEKLLKEAESMNHPFAIRETPSFNIKPVRSLPVIEPVKPLSKLSKEFPVSCGQQHHRKEVLESVYGKWQVVAKDEATKMAVKELVTSDKVFVEPETVNLDLGTVIANRISAVRQLQDNPQSMEAKEKMDKAQKALDDWTKLQQVPGQFTGSTGLAPMPKNVLERGKQAWFKADDLKNAKPVVGIGKSLLQKMGWKPGTALGKSMPGRLEPLSLNVKNDRRGLSSFMETPAPGVQKKPKPQGASLVKDLSTKHPVSALMEICSKRHWPPPEFRLVDPLNLKVFTFRIIVCNDEYIGKPANNKKQAKMLAATVALQNMGLIPKPST